MNNTANKDDKVEKPSVGKWVVIISFAVFMGNMMSFGVEKTFQYWEQEQQEAANAAALDKVSQEKARREQIEAQARQQLIDAVRKSK